MTPPPLHIDEASRQWLKSCQGLGVSETPREVSFGGHAILGDTIMVIADALLDERFHDNPLVVGSGDSMMALARLAAELDALNRDSRRGYEIRFSVGEVACDPGKPRSIDALLGDADARMYERKRRKLAA